MSVWWCMAPAGVIAVLLMLWRRDRCLLVAERRRAASLASDASRLSPLRTSLRGERRRVRRSHQLKRRAQRVLGMARALVGSTDPHEAALRACRAMVDGFGARGSAVWTVGRPAVLLAAAGGGPLGEAPSVPRPAGRGIEQILLLDDQRCPVGRLLVDFERPGRTPSGLSTYAAVLGAVLGACTARSGGGSSGDSAGVAVDGEHRHGCGAGGPVGEEGRDGGGGDPGRVGGHRGAPGVTSRASAMASLRTAVAGRRQRPPDGRHEPSQRSSGPAT